MKPPQVLDLEALYLAVKEEQHDDALDLLFHAFDRAFSQARFEEVDEALRKVDVDRLDAHTAFGLLTASYPAKDKLPARSSTLERVRYRLHALNVDEQRIEALLREQR